jgi:putative type II/III system pilus formation protein
MSPKSLIPLIAVAGVIATAAPAAALAGVVARIDEATAITLSAPAASVVVGNPSIADATIVDRRRVAILGRSYGTTNVMVFDTNGRVIYNGLVNVTSPTAGHVSLYRGALVHNYSCGARCERTPMPGEQADGVYQPFAQPYKDYSDRTKTPGN